MKATLLSFSLALLSIPAYGQPNIVLSNTTDSRAAQSINDNFTEMDRKKANKDDLSVYATKAGDNAMSGDNTFSGANGVSGTMTFSSPPIISVNPTSTPTVNALYSKLVPKLWVTFLASGVVKDGIGVSSVTHNATGLFTVHFNQSFANAYYACSCSSEPDGFAFDHCQPEQGGKIPSQIYLSNYYSDIELQDPISISLVCFGSQ